MFGIFLAKDAQIPKLVSAHPQNWLSKEMKDTSCHIISQKDQQFKRKLTFDIPKFKFQNGLKLKTPNFWAFLRQTCLLGA